MEKQTNFKKVSRSIKCLNLCPDNTIIGNKFVVIRHGRLDVCMEEITQNCIVLYSSLNFKGPH